MKIDPKAYNVGKPRHLRPADGEAEATVRKAAAGKAEGNTDKILISSEGALKAETDGLAKAIVAAMDGPTPPEKLEALQAAVDEGSYHVPTDKLVDALMRRWMGIA